MVSITQPHEGQTQLNFQGDFTFEDHQEFRSTLKLAFEKSPQTLVICLEGVKYIDSSALGMLLLAMEECRTKTCKMSIIGATGYVAEVLDMVMLDRLIDRGQA